MSLFQNVLRRARQFHLLFRPPPQLRRAHVRFAVNLPIKVRELSETAPQSRIAVDVSDGGLFFEPAMPVATGTVVEVSVGLFLRNARAAVVAHRHNGTALLFESPAHGAAIRAWLTEMANDTRAPNGIRVKACLSEQPLGDQPLN
ncbi:MAG: PilZ domain-containing protein [Minwuia sp.]|nr:PilZ domain-containing protein [Minwuia sp.]